METKDAMVDGWTKPSPMLRITELSMKANILMLQETKIAKLILDLSKFQVIPMLPKAAAHYLHQ